MLKFEKKYIKYLRKCNSIQIGGVRYTEEDLKKLNPEALIKEYMLLDKDFDNLKETLENRITDLSNNIMSQTSETKKYKQAFEQTSESMQKLKTRLAEVSKQHHTPGTFGDTDPARPETFTEQHDTIKVTVKLYCNYCVTRFNSVDTFRKFILPNLINHVQPNVTAADVGLADVDFYRALMRASLAKEMFLHFESDTFDATSTNIPATIDWESQDARRRNNAGEFKQIMAQTAPDVYTNDQYFRVWLEGLIWRLKQAWTLGDDTWFLNIFNTPEEPKGKGGTIADVFLVNAQKVWALHKLSRAYPLGVQIIRFAARDNTRPEIFGPHDSKAPKYCINSFNEGSVGETVAFPVWPGFQLDNFIYPSDVVWIPDRKLQHQREEEQRQQEERQRQQIQQRQQEEQIQQRQQEEQIQQRQQEEQIQRQRQRQRQRQQEEQIQRQRQRQQEEQIQRQQEEQQRHSRILEDYNEIGTLGTTY